MIDVSVGQLADENLARHAVERHCNVDLRTLRANFFAELIKTAIDRHQLDVKLLESRTGTLGLFPVDYVGHVVEQLLRPMTIVCLLA
jgi:hypothetical protein